jgi:hypothetical protein
VETKEKPDFENLARSIHVAMKWKRKSGKESQAPSQPEKGTANGDALTKLKTAINFTRKKDKMQMLDDEDESVF